MNKAASNTKIPQRTRKNGSSGNISGSTRRAESVRICAPPKPLITAGGGSRGGNSSGFNKRPPKTKSARHKTRAPFATSCARTDKHTGHSLRPGPPKMETELSSRPRRGNRPSHRASPKSNSSLAILGSRKTGCRSRCRKEESETSRSGPCLAQVQTSRKTRIKNQAVRRVLHLWGRRRLPTRGLWTGIRPQPVPGTLSPPIGGSARTRRKVLETIPIRGLAQPTRYLMIPKSGHKWPTLKNEPGDGHRSPKKVARRSLSGGS